MSKCTLIMSMNTQIPISHQILSLLDNNLDYTITDHISCFKGKIEKSATIEFHYINKSKLEEIWKILEHFLWSFDKDKHCAYCKWHATEFSGCICEFFEEKCPNKKS